MGSLPLEGQICKNNKRVKKNDNISLKATEEFKKRRKNNDLKWRAISF
jgi:hypothetical protein